MGPCYLRDAYQTEGLGMSGTCDKSKEQYMCVECCQGDACNYRVNQNTASSISQSILYTCSVTFVLSRYL